MKLFSDGRPPVYRFSDHLLQGMGDIHDLLQRVDWIKPKTQTTRPKDIGGFQREGRFRASPFWDR